MRFLNFCTIVHSEKVVAQSLKSSCRKIPKTPIRLKNIYNSDSFFST